MYVCINTDMERGEVPAATSNFNIIAGVKNVIIEYNASVNVFWLISNMKSVRVLKNRICEVSEISQIIEVPLK